MRVRSHLSLYHDSMQFHIYMRVDAFGTFIVLERVVESVSWHEEAIMPHHVLHQVVRRRHALGGARAG